MPMLPGTHPTSYVLHKHLLFSFWVSVSCGRDVAAIVHFLILLTLAMQNSGSSGTVPYLVNLKAMYSLGQLCAMLCCHEDVEEGQQF